MEIVGVVIVVAAIGLGVWIHHKGLANVKAELKADIAKLKQ